jgi:CubicO group peptidase (beta-lactamase class C family)
VSELQTQLDQIAVETNFSGVVRLERDGQVEIAKAYGLAHRAHGVPNSVDTQFAIASGAKGFTALAVASLIEEGVLDLTTTARSLLKDDLPLIDEGVTVEHLLAHRSGIGDYLDEETDIDLNDYLMPVPVHQLVEPEDYLKVLDGFEMKFAPDEAFAYCNGGYVVLALLAERAGQVSYHDLVRRLVCDRAEMIHTEFLRSDELPATASVGYLDATGPRTNVFHLPVRGVGDGGIYTTLGDMSLFWSAFFGGRIVSPKWVDEMVKPRSGTGEGGDRYGLGFWLHPSSSAVFLEGMDAGVSFRSVHDPATSFSYTVISNTTEGAWPLVKILDRLV